MHKACTAGVEMGAKPKPVSEMRWRSKVEPLVCWWQWYLAKEGAIPTSAIPIILPSGIDELYGTQEFQLSASLSLFATDCSRVTDSFFIGNRLWVPNPIWFIIISRWMVSFWGFLPFVPFCIPPIWWGRHPSGLVTCHPFWSGLPASHSVLESLLHLHHRV